MIFETIGINIISNIIYDVIKKVQISSDVKLSKKQIEAYVKDRIDFTPDLKVTSDFLEQFFRLPQVVDTIHSYIIYVLNGNISVKLERVNSRHTGQTISQDDVLDYLVDCFQKCSDPCIIENDRNEIKNLFVQIFDVANDFFVSLLDRKTRIQVFEINRMNAYGISLVNEKLDKYGAMIEAALKYPLEERNSEFEDIRKDYMNILKKRYNKALIYLLDDFELDKFYIPPVLSVNSHNRPAVLFTEQYTPRDIRIGWLASETWTNIFSRENIVYITGGAGYGKSLLMKNIIINSKELHIPESSDHIVIYGEIKWCINEDGSFKSLPEFLKECIINSTLKEISDDFINYHLKIGRCILLLDALDEVPMEKRKDLHQTIIAHLKNLNPNNKACITSRDRGFIPVEDEIEHFSIEPLSPAQIEQYVDKIIALGKFDEHDKESFMQQARGLVEKRFLSSFLILSLLINIYKGERELPETKLELYQKCLEYIANKREKPKTSANFDWKLIAPLMKDNTFIELAVLCFPNNKEVNESEISRKLIHVYHDTFIDVATLENAVFEFLKFCSERTELFVPANVENSFKFFHRSFFEYFYSKHIVLRCKDSKEIFAELAAFDVDSEVFELVLARLKQETQDKYISLIKYVFDQCEQDLKSDNPSLKALNILVLFFQVIDEVTFQLNFVNMLCVFSKVITKNIKRLSNQEIIQNVIADTATHERIVDSYRAAIYKEIIQVVKGVDLRVLSNITELGEGSKIDASQQQIFIRHAILDRSLIFHFYTATMMSQHNISEILKIMLHQPKGLRKNNLDKIKEILDYCESADSNHNKIVEKLFTIQ